MKAATGSLLRLSGDTKKCSEITCALHFCGRDFVELGHLEVCFLSVIVGLLGMVLNLCLRMVHSLTGLVRMAYS